MPVLGLTPCKDSQSSSGKTPNTCEGGAAAPAPPTAPRGPQAWWPPRQPRGVSPTVCAPARSFLSASSTPPAHHTPLPHRTRRPDADHSVVQGLSMSAKLATCRGNWNWKNLALFLAGLRSLSGKVPALRRNFWNLINIEWNRSSQGKRRCRYNWRWKTEPGSLGKQ